MHTSSANYCTAANVVPDLHPNKHSLQTRQRSESGTLLVAATICCVAMVFVSLDVSPQYLPPHRRRNNSMWLIGEVRFELCRTRVHTRGRLSQTGHALVDVHRFVRFRHLHDQLFGTSSPAWCNFARILSFTIWHGISQTTQSELSM